MKKVVFVWFLIGLFAIFVFGMALASKEETKTKATIKVVTDTTKAEVKEAKTTATKKALVDTTKAEVPVFKYIGIKKCKACHNLPRTGKLFDKWLKGPHAKAYATLATEESIKLAKELKIKDPQKSKECLVCHITAYGIPDSLKGEKYSVEEGVTCEACHGPGEKYWTMKIMKNKKLAMENGLIEPTEELCITCHNEKSPTYKEFKYKDATKAIDHTYPRKEKSE